MKIAIVGASGAVGTELKELLSGKNLTCYDSKMLISFDGIDLAFFCVSKELAAALIPEAQKKGVICIDSSTAYREDPNVPLVIPEINRHALKNHPGIIASPNCTTTLMLLPLAPLHKKYGIKRIVASTYQAVSGAGYKGIEELEEQTKAHFENESIEPKIFPVSCGFNVFPHEAPDFSEAKKMHTETQKILEDPSISVSATCIRVPVFRVHCQSLNIEFRNPVDFEKVQKLLANASGVKFKETLSALDAKGQKPVFCSSLREDPSNPNTINLWVVGDQLLKGAALNMAQIAKCL